MRLGKYPALLTEGSHARTAYGAEMIEERHRHRYEFNLEFANQLKDAGLRLTGTSPDGKFVEIVELGDHPWFLGCQFHPEYRSRPSQPHPLFKAFVSAMRDYRKIRLAMAAKAQESEIQHIA
jgi:CTP synthase